MGGKKSRGRFLLFQYFFQGISLIPDMWLRWDWYSPRSSQTLDVETWPRSDQWRGCHHFGHSDRFRGGHVMSQAYGTLLRDFCWNDWRRSAPLAGSPSYENHVVRGATRAILPPEGDGFAREKPPQKKLSQEERVWVLWHMLSPWFEVYLRSGDFLLIHLPINSFCSLSECELNFCYF